MIKTKSLPPLADKMRPVNLDDILGQDHILGKGKLLQQAIESDNLFSFIIWGPPGCGKTTLARAIAKNTKNNYVEYSAVLSGISEVKGTLKEAALRTQMYQQKTILFIDEIHRFNKAQQDAFLHHIEDGTIILIGSTTYNPFFEVISALSSRVKIYQLKSLSAEDIKKIIERALTDSENGLGEEKIKLEPSALDFIVNLSNGDARVALNLLENAHLLISKEKTKVINLKTVQEIAGKKYTLYDKKGDYHYDIISAFIKSLRGGDPDAALYWLARMIKGGEDPRFIARRMVIAAAEDVGEADPQALLIATSAAQAVELIGLPEAQIPLAQAAVHIACAPKSNSVYKGIAKALQDVEDKTHMPVPLHLRNPAYPGAKKSGVGADYKYPHNFEGHFVQQQYLPDNLINQIYYHPSDEGFEAKIKEKLKQRWTEKYKEPETN